VDANQVLIVEQKALANEHERTLNRIFQFLSIEPIPIVKEDVFSITKKMSQSAAARLVAKFYFSLFS
jgi:hypothetical protein